MAKPKKQRVWRLLALLLLLLPLLLIVGLNLVLRSEAGMQFLSENMGRVLGVELQFAAIELEPGFQLGVRIRQLEVRLATDPNTEPLLRAPLAVAAFHWPAILTGQLIPLDWSFESPVVVVPDLKMGGEARKGPPDLPPISVEVRDGRVIWRHEETRFEVQKLDIDVERSALSQDLEGRISAEILVDEERVGRTQGVFEGSIADIVLDLQLQELDLAKAKLRAGKGWQGKINGRVRATRNEKTIGATLDLDIDGFEVLIPGIGKTIRPQDTKFRGRIRWEDDALHIEPETLQIDDINLSGDITVAKKRGKKRLGLKLDLANFNLGHPYSRLNVLRLMGLRHQTWRDLDKALKKGLVEKIRLEADLPLEGIGNAVALNHKLAPHEFKVHAEVRNAFYSKDPNKPPIENIDAMFDIGGDLIRARNVSMSREGKPLPNLDISIDGLSVLAHLPAEERGRPAGPGVEIPGLGSAFASFANDDEDGEKAPSPVVRFWDFYLGYHAFLLPFRNASGRLRFPEGQVHIENAEGVLGGAPAKLHAVWEHRKNEITVQITYLDGVATPGDLPTDRWAGGRIHIDQASFGDWKLENIETDLVAMRETLRFENVVGQAGGGEVKASGFVSLDKENHAPVGISIQAQDVDANYVGLRLKLDDGALKGKTAANGTLAGRLEPGSEFLDHGEVKLHADLRDGSLQGAPAMLVLARLPSLQGLRGLFGQPLPYDKLAGDFTIKDGVFRTENFFLEGPELRLVAAGEINIRDDDLPTDMTIALLFLQTVDRVINQLPILRDVVLGKNKSLLTVYFKIEGPWRDPSARLLPPEMIQNATGWTGRVISGGVRQFRRIILGETEKKDESKNQPSP